MADVHRVHQAVAVRENVEPESLDNVVDRLSGTRERFVEPLRNFGRRQLGRYWPFTAPRLGEVIRDQCRELLANVERGVALEFFPNGHDRNLPTGTALPSRI